MHTNEFEVLKGLFHDLKSPLSVMTLLRPEIESWNGEVAELLAKSIRHIEQLSTRLRVIEKSTLPRQNQTPLQELREMLVHLAESKGTEYQNLDYLEVRWHLSLNESFAGLHGALHEWQAVLSNLVNNAHEASASRVEIVVQEGITPGQLTVEITDNGKGMSAARIRKFNKGEVSSNKAPTRGHGLRHAWSLIETAGGRLRFGSSSEKGLRIQMTLPIK